MSEPPSPTTQVHAPRDWLGELLERSGLLGDVGRGIALVLGCLAVALLANAVRSDRLPLALGRVPAPGLTLNVAERMRFVPAAEALELREQSGAVLVDGRSASEWEEIRAAGAVRLPYRGFAAHFPAFRTQFPPERTVVVYGQGPPTDHGLRVAARLLKAGYQDVRVVQAGLAEWVEQGLPTERGTP